MHRIIIPAFIAFACLVPAAAAPAPANVLLARGRTEPSLAIDPAKPSFMVVASNTNYSAPVGNTYPDAFFVSHDGGRSFQFRNAPIVYPYTTEADPAVAIAASGTVFFIYLAETPSYCSGGSAAIILSASYDGGRGFQRSKIVDASSADDKPALAIQSIPHGKAHLFVTWTRWHNHSSDIWYARSIDGGESFSRPRMLYSSRLNNFGSAPVVGPHGAVYVFWSHFPNSALTATTPTRIFMRVSLDDGAHFGPVRAVTRSFTAIPGMAEPGSLRNLTGPAAAVSPSGAIYLSWAAVSQRYGNGVVNADIMISRSTNRGKTWTVAHRVNDVRARDRFMPAVSVLKDDSVGVAFYDRRRSLADLDVYAARISFQGGFHASQNVRVDGGSSPIDDIYYIKPGSTCFSPGRFFGDYIGAAAVGAHDLGVAWADTRFHVSGETDVWFARVRLP